VHLRENRVTPQLRELKEFSSLDEAHEVCTRNRAGLWASGCVDGFQGAKIKGLEQFLYILTNADAFALELHDAQRTVVGGGVAGTATHRVVEVRPLETRRPPMGMLSAPHVRFTLQALENAFQSLLREAGVR
jgi:hypothetical protein